MLNADTILTLLTTDWAETDPAAASVKFTVDEFDPNNPSIQVRVDDGKSTESLVIAAVFKTVQDYKISVFLKPTHFEATTIAASKITFYKVLEEITRIIKLEHYGFTVSKVMPLNWANVNLPKGFSTKAQTKTDAPIAFTAELNVSLEYYNIGASVMTVYLENIVEDATPQLGGNLDVNNKTIVFPTTPITDVLDEDNMASNSASKLATQQSIKAYVDAAIIAAVAAMTAFSATEHVYASPTRVGDTAYTVPAGKPILLNVSVSSDEAADQLLLLSASGGVLTVANIKVYQYQATANKVVHLVAIIPAGWKYEVTTTLHFEAGHVTVAKWVETELGN